MSGLRLFGVAAAALTAIACATHVTGPAVGQEATSLSGRALFAPPIADDTRRQLEARLAEAAGDWQRDPSNVDAIIWLGRRTAYLGRFREAIEIYTEGIRLHPREARLYRHRGHRYITTRQLAAAIADLERAAALVDGQPDQVEPDGQPNARSTPTSTLHSNIWYHLALARYLRRDYAGAAAGWARARDAVDNPDNLVAASNWLYLSLMRSGRPAAEGSAVLARITAGLDVIENGSYHSLLLLYKGERTADEVLRPPGGSAAGSAVRYGVGAWHHLHGRTGEARRIWTEVLAGPDWPSFGYLAAEAER